jgi:methionyl-tRNA synthetase
LLSVANRYFDAQAPWALGKRGERTRLGTVLFTTLEAAWRAAWLLEPIVPRASARVREELGGGDAARSESGAVRWNPLLSETLVNVGRPLFPKLRTVP